MSTLNFFKMKIHKRTCKFCGKEFTSVNKNVVENNYSIHIGACKSKQKKSDKHSKSSQKSSTTPLFHNTQDSKSGASNNKEKTGK